MSKRRAHIRHQTPQGPLLVEWQDSAQPVPSWRFLDDAPAMAVVACVSVGWVVQETREVLMLAPNLGDQHTPSAQGSGFIRIPKRAVTRRVNLRASNACPSSRLGSGRKRRAF